MSAIDIQALSASPKTREMLSEILIEMVATRRLGQLHAPARCGRRRGLSGMSALAAADRGERIVLGAFDGDILAGTVSLLLDCRPISCIAPKSPN